MSPPQLTIAKLYNSILIMTDKKLPSNETNSKKKSRECVNATCIESPHGVFPVCKRHFRIGVSRFKWNPSHIGLQTLRSISFINEMFDLSLVTEKDIYDGKKSRIPLKCNKCTYTWKPSIENVINGGSGCPDCAGKVQWTLERLLQRAQATGRTDDIDFSLVTETDIDNGSKSHIPLKCNKCAYTWKPSINVVINKGRGCPDCSGNTQWTLKRLLHRAETTGRTDDIDFSLVTETDIDDGYKSLIPLKCNKCAYTWKPSIGNVITKGRGCPGCGGSAHWTLTRLLHRAETTGRTDDIDFSSVTEKDIDDGCNSRIPLKCNKCAYTWKPSISSVINGGTGCLDCAGSVQWTLERLLQRAEATGRTDDIDFSSVTETDIDDGKKSRIPLKCNKCACTWKPSIESVINGGSGCPKCCRSKMELHGEKVLKSIKSTPSMDSNHWSLIEFIQEFYLDGSQNRKGYKGCKTGVQRADFMLKVRCGDGTIINIALEFDGLQHFTPVSFGGRKNVDELKNDFLKRQYDDRQKEMYCEEKGFYMIRISFSVPTVQFEKLIRQIITSFCTPPRHVKRIYKGAEYEDLLT